MPFTPQVFGQKISALRSNFGQDLETFAQASGINPERLLSLEKGTAQPSGDEILILADQLKKDFRYFLADDAIDSDQGTETLFRRHGNELSSSDRISIAEFVYLCKNQAFLEKALNRFPPRPNFHFKPANKFYKGDGKVCASQLRQHLGLGDDEVVRDVYASMRSMGFKVFRRRLQNSRISGLFINHPDAGPCVLVNLADGEARQRFSAVHEWGHGLMDRQSVTFSTTGEWTSDDLVEVRANTFASEFLVPPVRLRTLKARWSDAKIISDWSSRFRVSVPALLSTLLGNGLITKEQRDMLRQTVTRPADPPDPEMEGKLTDVQRSRKRLLIEQGLSKSYVGLCFDGFARGVISFGLLGEMLLSSVSGVREVAELFGQSTYRND